MTKIKQPERYFEEMRKNVHHGQQSQSNMWFFLCSSFVLSLLMVGGALYWATQSTYLFDKLNVIFKIELVLFLIHFLTILITLIKNNITHILLSISTVFFAYKMVFDPFIFLYIMYVGFEVYDQFALVTYVLMGVGVLLHYLLIWRSLATLYRPREGTGEVNVKKRLSVLAFGFIFFISSFMAFVIHAQIFDYIEILIFFISAFVIYFGVLIGLVDYIIATYCIIRFPSFRIQAIQNEQNQLSDDTFIKENEMKVREESLILQNVVCVEEVISHDEWYKPVIGLRTNLVSNNIYQTSPVIFKVEEFEDEPNFGKYSYYVSINTIVEEEDFFTQVDTLEIGPAIWVRCAEVDELEDAYALLEYYAKKRDWELEKPYYHVVLDVFDDVIMDVYAVVKGVDVRSW